jgi:hypothetical protein
MVALLGLVAPGWRQRAPSASGLGSGQLQPWGPRTSVQLIVALNRSATLPPQPGAGRGGSVAEAFNQATSWTQVLGPHGWTCPDPDPDADGARWRHPGATNPKSATIRYGLLFVYSAATPFQPTEPGAPRGYSRFRAYAVLKHGGDLRAAARALREATR